MDAMALKYDFDQRSDRLPRVLGVATIISAIPWTITLYLHSVLLIVIIQFAPSLFLLFVIVIVIVIFLTLVVNLLQRLYARKVIYSHCDHNYYCHYGLRGERGVQVDCPFGTQSTILLVLCLTSVLALFDRRLIGISCTSLCVHRNIDIHKT